MKLNGLGRERINVLICIFLLFGITFSVFTYTVGIREPWFGQLNNNDHHQWLTGSTLKFSTNWYNEGPIQLRFAMLENPKSIEFPTLLSRDPYTSYPPGAIIPIYIISKLVSHEPTASLVMRYNLLNQFLVAFILALIIFFFLMQLKIDIVNAFLFSLIPVILELLLPAPLYFFQNVFFSDQAVILPFVLYIFLEVLRDEMNGRNLRILNIIQNIVLFYGFLTDWLFVFIALTVYMKRIISGEIVFSRKISLVNAYSFIKESLKYWLVPLITVALFVLQVIILGTEGFTLSKMFLRMGVTEQYADILKNGLNVFLGYLLEGYGQLELFLLICSAIFSIFVTVYIIFKSLKKQKMIFGHVYEVKKILYLIGLFLIPCVLEVYVFKNHSIIHDFSVLKFSVPISSITLVLLPILIFFMTENFLSKTFKSRFVFFRYFFNKFHINPRLFVILLLSLFIALGNVAYIHPSYTSFFPTTNGDFKIVGESIHKNTYYNDVVFSPDFEIPENPPVLLSYSMKRVYQINSTEDIKNKINGLSGNYNIVIIFLYPPSNYWKKLLTNTTYTTDDTTDGTIYYYRINPTTFNNSLN